jgi:hypothetical protein
MKHMAKRGKMAVEKWGYRAKSRKLGLKNHELSINLERQNGAKCRF